MDAQVGDGLESTRETRHERERTPLRPPAGSISRLLGWISEAQRLEFGFVVRVVALVGLLLALLLLAAWFGRVTQ